VLRCVAERVAVSCVVLHVVMLAGCRHQFCGALQCVLWRVAVRAAVCCSACCIKLCHVARNDARRHFLRCVAVRVTVCYNVGCGVLWCVVVCCGVLHAVLLDLDAAPAIAGIFAKRCGDLRSDCSVLRCVAVCCSVLQCVAVSNGVLQCVLVCYSVLLCIA